MPGGSGAQVELLIVDDGSTDRSPEILAELTRRKGTSGYRTSEDLQWTELCPEWLHVRVITLPCNRGLVCALNVGLATCRTALVARMDVDDVSEPRRLQRQWEYMCCHPEVQVLGSQAVIIYDNEGGGINSCPDDTGRDGEYPRDVLDGAGDSLTTSSNSTVIGVQGGVGMNDGEGGNTESVKAMTANGLDEARTGGRPKARVSRGGTVGVHLGEVMMVPTHACLVHWEMMFRCAVIHPAVVFRVEAIRSVGGYGGGCPSECGAAEDYDLWLRVLRR